MPRRRGHSISPRRRTVVVGLQEDSQPPPQGGVAGAGPVQEGGALAGRLSQGLMEEGFFVHGPRG